MNTPMKRFGLFFGFLAASATWLLGETIVITTTSNQSQSVTVTLPYCADIDVHGNAYGPDSSYITGNTPIGGFYYTPSNGSLHMIGTVQAGTYTIYQNVGFSGYLCVMIMMHPPVTFPAGTTTRDFTMPAYDDNGVLRPKSVITIGVMPDLTTAAIINGNKWISAPAWLDGYMTNPDWMMDNNANEDEPARMVFGFLPVGPAIPHIIRGVTIIVTEQTAVDAAAATAVLTGEEATLLAVTYMASWAIEVLRLRLPDGVFSYVTYEKIQPVNHKVYAGRTAGRGVPLVVLARRDAAHAQVRPDYNGAILQSSTTWSGLSFRGYLTSNADFGELSTYRAYASAGVTAPDFPIKIGPPFSRPPLTNP